MSPLFWQYLLGAELPPQKARDFLASLGSHGLDPIAALRTWPGLTDAERRRVDGASSSRLERALDDGVHVLEHPQYPPTAYPEFLPPALFVWGDPDALTGPRIAIVGTRRASVYGRAVAHKFAQNLAQRGVGVISGGALGIDGAAHRGSLAADGRTAAVLAGGLDRLYPAAHKGLFQQIREERGCLVSQFALGTEPLHYNFLTRNATVVALSDAVLVVEAPAQSGSIHTALHAVEQGKPVFVVPATIDHEGFRGSHALIRDGALLVDHPGQIAEVMGWPEPHVPEPERAEDDPVTERILAALTLEPVALDRIADATEMDPADLAEALTDLELDGRVLREGVGYARVP